MRVPRPRSAHVIRRAGLVLLAAALLGGTCASIDASGRPDLSPWTAVPRLPVAGEYRYTLTARVRPLLVFWISRPDVGLARIVRGHAADGRSYELLIGSEPDKAPMRFNRWGYVWESNQAGGTRLVALMTESNEESVDQAKAALNRKAGSGHAFKAIRASVADGEARAQVVRVAFAQDYTLRDVDTVLKRLPEGGEPTARVQVPGGTRPGFLVALADLIHENVEAVRGSGRPSRGSSRAYVYDRSLYTVTQTSSALVPLVRLGSSSHRNCVDGEFEIRNRTTGNTSTFHLTYATEGALAEVPVRIVYRPRWYFEAELTLEAWQ